LSDHVASAHNLHLNSAALTITALCGSDGALGTAALTIRTDDLERGEVGRRRWRRGRGKRRGRESQKEVGQTGKGKGKYPMSDFHLLHPPLVEIGHGDVNGMD